MRYQIEIEQEDDGRWIAEVPDLPGVMAYGPDRATAVGKVQALVLRVLTERLERGEEVPEPLTEDYLQERARRGSREKYEAALAQVPDVEPDEYDRI
jgi:predicted RNase H-like HicB family nuclease